MQTVNLTLYTFDDLPENVQKGIIARERWNLMESCMDSYNPDYHASLKKFEEIFNVNCSSWSVDYSTSFYHFEIDKEEAFEWYRFDSNESGHIELSSLKGKLLMRYLQNQVLPYITKGKYYGKLSGAYPNAKHIKRYSNIILDVDCVMTGTCYDNYLLYPLFRFIKNPSQNITYKELMDMCLKSFFTEWHNEYCYWADDENAIREELHNNQYEDRLYYKNGLVTNIPECAYE